MLKLGLHVVNKLTNLPLFVRTKSGVKNRSGREEQLLDVFKKELFLRDSRWSVLLVVK